jgi:hypothetical protein
VCVQEMNRASPSAIDGERGASSWTAATAIRERRSDQWMPGAAARGAVHAATLSAGTHCQGGGARLQWHGNGTVRTPSLPKTRASGSAGARGQRRRACKSQESARYGRWRGSVRLEVTDGWLCNCRHARISMIPFDAGCPEEGRPRVRWGEESAAHCQAGERKRS